MELTQAIEVFTLITGLVYMVMQSLQHKWMWYANIFTSGGALTVACITHIWASAAINAYFLVMDIVGIVTWKKLEEKSGSSDLHVVPMTKGIATAGALVAIILGAAISWILARTNDPNPVADGIAFSLSVVGAWWLTRSHMEEWYVWMAADLINIWLFVSQGLWGMAALYGCYLVNAVFGITYWSRKGKKVEL